MIQICQKDKEKVFEAIRTGKIDAAEMSFPNLIDDILLCLAVAAKLKCKTRLTDVPINACVVHDRKTDKYFVFMTTDTGRTARQIINTYELRLEIEKDFR